MMKFDTAKIRTYRPNGSYGSTLTVLRVTKQFFCNDELIEGSTSLSQLFSQIGECSLTYPFQYRSAFQANKITERNILKMQLGVVLPAFASHCDRFYE
jgi:hypothetical protein